MREPAEIDSDDDGPVIARAAAIDVAKATGMVCARVPHAGKPDRKVTKVWEVDATTAAIIELAGHLTGLGIERVVLEEAGDYWRCWHYLLSAAELECWLVNARDVKNVPGRPGRPAEQQEPAVPPVTGPHRPVHRPPRRPPGNAAGRARPADRTDRPGHHPDRPGRHRPAACPGR